MIKSIGLATLAAGLLMVATARAEEAAEGSWPKEIVVPEGTLVVYQPQPERLEGDILSSRAAFAVELKESTEPAFGAVWVEARLETDRANRTAVITDLRVTEVRFPDEDRAKEQKIKSLVEREAPKWDLVIDMDRLLTTLEFADKRLEEAQNLENLPPKIYVIREPSVLVTIDGEPRLQREEGFALMRVINTPFTILFDPSVKTYYLNADAETWYTSQDIAGDWAVAKKVPPEVASRAPGAAPEEGEGGREGGEPGLPPKIVVSTEPAELIALRGEPEYTPIPGTDLLYTSNTDSDVLMDIGSQQHYVLLSGRWFVSGTLDGPWKYVPGEKLPEDFAKIPEDSEMGTVLYAVPGTDIAREAVLDAQIPQTAAVERKKATLAVEYDGEPKFEKIEGTKMTYAVNTATPVIKAGNSFYACDEAVWFVADGPRGPWRVAASVPDEIYTIPAESPLYNVTFVRVYKAADEVVHVGYTPGYTHTYVYHNTIVYGTGHWWPGWYGRYYYPRPSTWGFHARYNPWSGWGFGLSYSSGPFTFSLGAGGWYRGGWWGPRHYQGYHQGYRHGYRRGSYSGYRAGYRAGRRYEARDNIYRSGRNEARTLPPSARADARARAAAAGVATGAGAAAKAASRANNVYAGRNGEVYRQTDQGWQQRTGSVWQDRAGDFGQAGQGSQAMRDQASLGAQARQPTKTPPSQARPAAPSYSGAGSTRQQLDRNSQARERGAQRASSFRQSSRPSQPAQRPSRPSGRGTRGAGGGRGGRGR